MQGQLWMVIDDEVLVRVSPRPGECQMRWYICLITAFVFVCLLCFDSSRCFSECQANCIKDHVTLWVGSREMPASEPHVRERQSLSIRVLFLWS